MLGRRIGDKIIENHTQAHNSNTYYMAIKRTSNWKGSYDAIHNEAEGDT